MDIEIFFKFLKQYLNFAHLLNRFENIIKVVMYATITLALLLAEYKKINNLERFKMPKLKFEQELEKFLNVKLAVEIKQLASKIIYQKFT